MDFLPVFMKMIELSLIILIGYITTKLGVMNSTLKASLSKIILYISLPCTILASIMTTDTFPSNKEILISLAVAFISYVIFFILAKFTTFVLRLKGSQKSAAEFGIIFSNVGYIGYPVTQAIFGPDCLFVTCLFNMPFNLVCYSFGVYLLNQGSSSENGEKMDKKKLMKLIINPSLVASIVCIIMAFTGLEAPTVIGETCAAVGGITTPGALLIIGAALGQMNIKQMFNNIYAYAVTFSSIIITPIVIMLAFKLALANYPLILGEAVIISAMPVATAGTMLCVEHGGDETFMAQITFLTTVISLFTIPLIATIL